MILRFFKEREYEVFLPRKVVVVDLNDQDRGKSSDI